MDAKSKYPICRHIRTDGHRCQSPALDGATTCYYHRKLRRTHRPASGPGFAMTHLRPETIQYLSESGQTEFAINRPPPRALNFPPLEDAESVQIAISVLFSAIAAGQVESLLARNLLYALQLASFNVRVLPPAPRADADFTTLARRVVHTRHGHANAAPGDGNGTVSEANRPKTLLEEFREDYPRPEHPQPQSNDDSTRNPNG